MGTMRITDGLKHYSCSISPAELSRIWTWLLNRQGLGTGKLDSVVRIADLTLGLHSARLPSPVATVMVRSSSADVTASLFERNDTQELTTLRCMRRTLHTLPLPLAEICHSATVHFRERDALRKAYNLGVSSKLETASEAIMRVLEDEDLLSHREIERRASTNSLPVQAIRAALKVSWERGLVTYLNTSQRWDKERRMFGLTSKLHPGLDMNADRAKATTDLVHQYFDRYGPASIEDVSWWSGIGSTGIVNAMNQLPVDWVAIKTPWSDNPTFMLGSKLNEFYQQESCYSETMQTEFLAHEDVALKAYFETRKRYLGIFPQTKVFNQIGEVLPTIIYNGLIVGRWDWNNKTRTIDTKLFGTVPQNRRAVAELRSKYAEILHRYSSLTQQAESGIV